MNNTEQDRLRTLRALDLLDTLPEQEYDQLVELASEICGTPISLVSLVDEQRQWFKAAKGLSMTETHRDVSFCAHAIIQNTLFEIENAAEDLRFYDNALVTGELGIRFYAGMPLQAPDGQPIGTLCVIDTVPRTLTESQRRALRILTRQAEAQIALRAKQKALEQALAENQRLTASLQKSNNLFLAFMNHGPFMGYMKDAAGRFVFYNQQLATHFNIEHDAWLGKFDSELFPPEVAATFREHDLKVLAGNTPIKFDEVTPGPNGGLTQWHSFKFPCRQANGEVFVAGMSVDVTAELARKAELQSSLQEKNALTKSLEDSRLLFHTFLDSSPNLVYLKSEDGRYVFYNRLFAEYYGISQSEWIGKTFSDVLPTDLADRIRIEDAALLLNAQRTETQCEIPDATGQRRIFKSMKFTYSNAEGQKMIGGVDVEVTAQIHREQQLKEANRLLDQLATTDSLTGIANRRAFEADLAIEFANSLRRKRSLAMLLMDIDNFKRRNDELGHAAGDRALQIIGRVLSQPGRAGDLPARLGGEEFAVLLPDTDLAGAMVVALRIQSLLAQENAGPLPLTLSIGVVCLDETIQTPERLIACADDAMYQAKRNGKNCIVVHQERVAQLLNAVRPVPRPPVSAPPPTPQPAAAAIPTPRSFSFAALKLKRRKRRSRIEL